MKGKDVMTALAFTVTPDTSLRKLEQLLHYQPFQAWWCLLIIRSEGD